MTSAKPTSGAIEAPEPEPSRPDEELVSSALTEAREAHPMAPPRRFPDLSDRDVANPSRMLERPSWTSRLVWHLLFRRVAFEEKHRRVVREAARDGDLVFAMHDHSLLDYLYFHYAFLRFGLPLVWFANHLSTSLFRPIWRQVASFFGRVTGLSRRRQALEETDLLAFGLERGRPALLFLKRRGPWPWSPGQHATELLEVLVGAQLERIRAAREVPGALPRPIRIVPQLLIWSHGPDRYRRSFRDVLFGNPEAPGRLRKAINFLLHRRSAFVQMAEPIDLLAFLAEHGATSAPGEGDGPSEAELARKLRFAILKALQVEERVIKGPVLKRSKQIRQEIMRTPEMQAEIRRMSQELGRPQADVEKQVARYLKEMAADFSMKYVEALCVILSFVFDRLYSAVIPDPDGLERVREAGRTAPLVLLPCHRSHVDYLVISYLFYAHGLIPPHIAAGSNLNFFPLGKIFRRSGAFFLRRSFKGNEVYRVTFKEYLKKLVREGYWIEFFPEGGRSRTGKMLPPKYGLLNHIVESVKSGAAPDVKLVPTWVGYEHVIEEKSYTEELSGAEKKKENITGLLKTTKVLWSKYGRLYLSFADGLSIGEAMDEAGVRDLDVEDPRYQEFVRRLSYRVLDGIQSVARLTPSAVVSMALLMHPKRGVRRRVLIDRVGFLLDLASSKGSPLSKTLEHALRIRRQEVAAAVDLRDQESPGARHPLALGDSSPVARARGEAVVQAIDEVLGRYLSEKLVESHTFEDEVVYTPVPEERIKLDFYKNNIVHLVLREAIMATVVRGTVDAGAGGVTTVARLREAARFLSRTFKYEFVYSPDEPFDLQFDRTLDDFRAAGLLVPAEGVEVGAEGALRVPETGSAADTIAQLSQVVEPWVESYWLIAMGLLETDPAGQTEKDFVKKMQGRAQRLFQEGEILCPEASSSVTFKHALEAYTELGYLTVEKKGRDRVVRRLGGESDAVDPLPDLGERLKAFIHA